MKTPVLAALVVATAATLTAAEASQPTTAQPDLFNGVTPRFRYVADGLSDPFLSQQDRDEEAAGAMLDEAKRMVESDRTKAIRLLQTLRTQYPDSLACGVAGKLLGELRRPVVEHWRFECANWIMVNTTGILFDVEQPSESIALVGDYIVRVGDAMPRYTAVTVAEIRDKQIVLKYEGMEFLVQVNGK